ncbi:mucin-5AC-like isoform X3 [Scylla paramamosain]|uniref:mucin-5AC-like isoform X3 n=1 Tax=Scylla paramamosain TaxID=85552 RepID=UPI0030833541
MDDTQQLDCTQALLCDQDEEDELDETHHLVAWLEVNGSQHQVFGGKNIIGRDPDGCKIVIPNKVLSKQHAVVEVRAGTHTLSDLGSCNKTRLGKKCDDSGSETGSESMLPMMEDEEERSPSPVLSSRLHYSGSQNALQNGTDAKPVTSVFSQNSSILQGKGMSSSPSLDTPLSHLTDSLLQSSDVESSVVSASQSPTKKTALPSPSCTRRTDLEEYNSDASTDVEDNAPAQFYPNSPEKPALTSPVTSVPETPPHSSHKTIIADTPGCSSSNISIPETPAASYPSPSKMDTSLCSLSITSIPETQDCSSPIPCFPDTPITTGDTPAGVQKNDHPGQGPDNECSVFKKPLAISTVKASRSPNTPVRVGSSSKSSVATKSSESVSTRLFSAGSSDVVDLDAPTQVFTGSASSDIDLDVPTQVFTGDTSVDLDAPTQVFTGDTSVDLDAPTQVFTGDTNVDLDAPTQVFASSPPSDVDLDVPTQVFTGDTNIDLDAPTQVFTSDAPGDLDCHAPTQVFTSDAPVDIDSDAPTQVFTSDAPVDIGPDAPTQVFTSDAPVDIGPDAPTQVFTSDAPVDIGPDAPTQVFTSDAPVDIGPNTPTQVFTSDAPVDIGPDAPTQVFTSDAPVDIGPDAPTQVFTSDAPVNIGPDAPTQVFTSDAPVDIGPDAPTQVFTSDEPVDIGPDAPTQVFTSDAPVDIGPDAPTQVFTSDAPVDIGPDAPTQVFTSDEPRDIDPDAPTQVFTTDAPRDTDPDALTQVFTSDAPVDIGPDAPTQVFKSDASVDIDPDVPAQVFSDAPVDLGPDAPTQVFTSDAPEDIDPDVPTQVFTSDAPVDIGPDAPTQVFTSDAPVDIDPDAPTQVFISNASGDIDPDVPTQVFTTDAPKSIDGVEDKLDAAVTLVSSSDTPEISGDESCRQKLAASGNVKDIVSKGSSQLSHSHESVTDDPPSSPTLLYDPVDSDVPTQLFSGTCSDVLRPSSSIMEAWGHLESAASLKTSTPFVGHTSKENLEESDAASDISKSLFNEEDETDSLHGEKETGVFDIMEKSHKDLKEEYHSDESTDIEENTLTDTTPQTTHKSEKTVLSLKNAAECYVNKKRSMSKVPQNQALEGDCEEVLQFPTTFSSPGKDESLLMLTGQNTSSSTRKRRKHRQVIDSEPCSLESSQEAVPIKVSLSDCTFVSEESNEGIHLASPCKKGPEQSDWLSDSESEEDAKNQSQKLFDLPSDTEDPTQKEENILSSINRKTTDTVDVVQMRKNVLPPPTTRKSTRLVSRKASTPQKNGKRFRAASSATPASSSSVPVSTAPKYNQVKMSVSSSLTPASIPSSVLAPAFLTAATTSTTPTSTTSAPTCVPVPNLTIAPMTRRQTRRGKTELVTSSSTTIPVQSPTCTRRGKRSTPSYGIHSTGTIFNTVTTPISSPRTTSDTTLTTISNSNIITASTVTTLQDKRRTRSQRVSVLSPLNTRGKETETFNESTASPQPSTSAATNSSNSSANTRSRRSKQATIPSVIKVKVEVKDEDVQMTPLTTIKQEKEEIETPIDEQIIIKTEPKDDLPQDNLHKDSGQCRRTRRKPMRYSPERDISLPGRRSTSSGSSGSIQKEKTGNASAVITESSETPKDVPVQQRRSQRVLTSVQTRKQEGATSVLNSIRVKEEQEDFSEEYSESPIPLSITQTTKADPPPKKSRQSRASTSRGASQAPSRATKKIKMEFITKEESDEGHPEDSQSRITQPKAKQIKMSDCKKEEATKRVSRNSLSQQKAKRIKQESSDSASSSHSSVSSRATRSNKDVELWSPSRRQRQASTKPRVLFTGYDDPADLKIVSDLGGRMVETPHDCTVLVATSVKRTCKLLSAIGMGRPIVNPNWLTMSKAAGNFVDPWQFLLKDHAAEEKYGFCLEDTIKSASNFLLFEGLSIYATPSVQPPPCQMRDIVECAGGDYLHAPPRKYAPQIRIISCPEDKRLWPSFKSLGIPILGVEFILTGLLRHELLLEEFVLN